MGLISHIPETLWLPYPHNPTWKGHSTSEILSPSPVSGLTGAPMLQEGDSQYLSFCRVKILGIAWYTAQGKPRASLDGSSQKPNSVNSTRHWGENGRPPPFWAASTEELKLLPSTGFLYFSKQHIDWKSRLNPFA